jgi:hypothetical protein
VIKTTVWVRIVSVEVDVLGSGVENNTARAPQKNPKVVPERLDRDNICVVANSIQVVHCRLVIHDDMNSPQPTRAHRFSEMIWLMRSLIILPSIFASLNLLDEAEFRTSFPLQPSPLAISHPFQHSSSLNESGSFPDSTWLDYVL